MKKLTEREEQIMQVVWQLGEAVFIRDVVETASQTKTPL